MKILIVHPGPEWSVADLYAGWAEALAAQGHHVIGYPTHHKLAFYDGSFLQYDNKGPGSHKFRKALTVDEAIKCAVDGLFSALYRHHPDVLLIVSGFLIPAELLDLARFRGTKVVVLHTESPYEDTRQIEQAAHADLNLVNDPTNLGRFQAIAPTVYMPHAYRPALHKPGRSVPDLRSDMAFVGTGFESRIDFLEAMDLDGLDVLLAGNWQRLGKKSKLRKFVAHDEQECLDNDQTVKVYRSAKVGFNYYRRQDGEPSDGWSMGPREVEMAACGLFYLRDPRPEGDELLPMLPTFNSPHEATELLRWWLAHPRLRAAAARQARQALADRTFDRNAQVLIETLGKDQ